MAEIIENEELMTRLSSSHENDLPSYEESVVPTPLMRLNSCRLSATSMALASISQGHDIQYQIASKGGWQLLNSRSSSELIIQHKKPFCVGTMEFDNSSSFPWFPRANVTVDIPGYGTKKVQMKSQNFIDWEFKWSDSVSDPTLQWTVQSCPITLATLALLDKSRGLCLARFIYSSRGMKAEKGLSIGNLDIFAVEAYGLTMEAIICSCSIALKYWQNIGRDYRNPDVA
ncbi:hypothetical protein PFICI_13893 [Pestalotiopsis fici W106-1]|uniref:Uncharacterized protein n=1 Tax=Pestalotiopsis fici (strain W106-1 / CGMCC3.15140) TaxID=1229662 RepID=W3WLH8_PESFW|nr:uncharacterized protein PFICI_13893 [Pestalotiopsis fici W106-1]ETS74027.1 hypothetical protein PFICI_13893 [Pestalotiopsis fici W106-1]